MAAQAPPAFRSFVEATLRVRPGEGRRTALLFLHLALAAAVFYLGRTVRDTLFLSRYPLSALPWMFVAYGLASAVVAVAYARLADRVSRKAQIAGACAVGAVTFVGAWACVRADLRWIYPVFYVWTEIVANLFLVQFWILANDLHDARTAKRLFGTIGSARLLSSVVVGLAAGAVVRLVGTAQLILVLAGLMVLIALVAAVIAREAHVSRAERGGAPPRRVGRAPRLLADPYVRSLALVLLIAFTAVNVGDYQFKAIARATYQEDQLARFFALFYAGTGIVSFLFQLFVTPRILARLGVGWGMTVMPAGFGLASAGLVAAPGLPLATLMKFSDNGFQYAIQESTFQALYVPFAPDAKVRTRAFLEAVVKPLGYALAGLAIVAGAPLLAGEPERFAVLTLPLVALWLALIPLVRRRYLRQLETTLSARGAFALDPEFMLDAAGRATLVRTLEVGTPRQVLAALETLSTERSDDIERAVRRLTRHAEPAVRRAAVEHLAQRPEDARADLRAALDDADDDVRAAAALGYAAAAKDEAVDTLAGLLTGGAGAARVAALAGLLRHGGVEGGIVGGAELGRLLESPEPADRVAAGRALGHLGRDAYRPLRRLLDDAEPAVRRAALKAAPGVADPRLVPTLLGMLGDPSARGRAAAALVAVGRPAVRPVGDLLADAATDRAVRLELPRLLRRIVVTDAYEVLRAHLADGDSRLRLRSYAALSHLRADLARGPEPVEVVRALAEREIGDARRTEAGWAAARERFGGNPLLVELFAQRRLHAVRRLLRLLELRYEPAPLRLVRDHLGEPAHRANALEVLDTLLDPALRSLIMPFVDDGGRTGAAAGGDAVAFMRGQSGHPNPYIALLALDALARAADPGAAALADARRGHPSPLVREGAVLAAAAAPGPSSAALLASLERDDDPRVARLAARARARLAGGPTMEAPVYTTVEKILLLKNAPVFEQVAGEDLAPLASVAEVEVCSPGQALMREGEAGDSLYVVVRGELEVTRSGQRLSMLGPGDAVGEMSVLDRAPRSATATAVSETEVLRIGSEEFYEILHQQVEIAEGVIRMLSARLRDLDARLADRSPAA